MLKANESSKQHMQSEISNEASHHRLCESPWIARELGGLGISGGTDY